jgi:hypothetical protein
MTTLAQTESAALASIRKIFRQHMTVVSEAQRLEFTGWEIKDYFYETLYGNVPTLRLIVKYEGRIETRSLFL